MGGGRRMDLIGILHQHDPGTVPSEVGMTSRTPPGLVSGSNPEIGDLPITEVFRPAKLTQ